MSGLHRRLLDGSNRHLTTLTAPNSNDLEMNHCSHMIDASTPTTLTPSSTLALRRPSANMFVPFNYVDCLIRLSLCICISICPKNSLNSSLLLIVFI